MLPHCRRVCCISACLYLIALRHCSVKIIRSFRLFGRTPKEVFFIFSGRTFGASLSAGYTLYNYVCEKKKKGKKNIKNDFVFFYKTDNRLW